MEDRLERMAHRLGEVLGEPVVGEPRRLSGGASRETFAFEVASRGSLVIQIEQRTGEVNEAPGEAKLLAAAAAAGVPVPAVLAHGTDDPALGAS